MTAQAEILDSPEACEAILAEWAALAHEIGQPFSLPAWMLAWWRHMRPDDALLRVVAVQDRGDLIGVVPLYLTNTRRPWRTLRPLGTGHRISPLSRPGKGPAVAQAALAALEGSTPTPRSIRLERADAGSPWPALMSQAPGSRSVVRLTTERAPVLVTGGRDFDQWLAGQSGNFRQQARSLTRRFARDGGTLRMTDSVETLEPDLRSFLRLHLSRERPGGSGLAHPGTLGMLVQAGRDLLPTGRLRLWCADIAGETVAAVLVVRAGREAAFWNIGWSPDAARYKPGVLTLLRAVQDALDSGCRRFDLGGGATHYKTRFADSDAPLAWDAVVLTGPWSGMVRCGLMGERAEGALRSRARGLPPPLRDVLQRARRVRNHSPFGARR